MKITFEHFKNLLLKESHHFSEKLFDDLGEVLRMKPGKAQQKLAFGYPGFVFFHKKVNPNFYKNLPYIILININGEWQMHFENFSKLGNKPKILDDMYKAIADTFTPKMELCTRGGATPGGLSGISKLTNYGFKKEFENNKMNTYWGGELDKKKLDEWLTSGKHLDEFLVTKDGSNHNWNIKGADWVVASEYKGDKPFTINNTKPRPFKMIKV